MSHKSKLLILQNIISSTPNRRPLYNHLPKYLSPDKLNLLSPIKSFSDSPPYSDALKKNSPTSYNNKLIGSYGSKNHLGLLAIKSTSPQYANFNLSLSSSDNSKTNALCSPQSSLFSLIPSPHKGQDSPKANLTLPLITINDKSGKNPIDKTRSYFLGRGISSTVVAKVKNSKIYALKRLKFKSNAVSDCNSYNNEMNAFQLKHPNIIRTFAIKICKMGELSSKMSIYMEYGGSETLHDFVGDHGCKKDVSDSVTFLYGSTLQLASALDYCHKNGIIHMDVKPKNILKSPGGTLKLGDFGCSINTSDALILSKKIHPNITNNCGTWQYMCPELIKGENPTYKADIYSLGITMWHMLYKEIPYKNREKDFVLYNVVKNELRPRCAKLTSKVNAFKSLMTSCWHQIPAERPGASMLITLFRDLLKL